MPYVPPFDPNGPFFWPQQNFIPGPLGPLVIGSGLNVSNTGILSVTAGGVGTVTQINTGAGLVGGPIVSAGTISLDISGVTPGTYTFPQLSVDAYGRILTISSSPPPILSVSAALPITSSGGANPVIGMINSGVTAGSYTNANITVDARGIVTSASSGSPGGNVLSVTASAPIASSGGANPNISLNASGVSPGTYTYSTFTVGANGLITFAQSGTPPVTNVSASSPLVSSGGTTPTLSLSSSGVTAGTYSNPTLQVDALGRITSASSGTVVTSVSATAPITVTGTTTPTIGVQAASTTQPGVVQLNNTTSSTSTTQALTAAQGKNLQDQISALSVTSNLTLAGTIDGSTGAMLSVTVEGAAQSFVVGQPLPAPAAGNSEFFVIVSVGGTMTPTGGSPTLTHTGDWFLSNGTIWQFLDVGYNPPYANTTTPGVVTLATDAETAAGTNTTDAVVPSALQSKLSDSVTTTSSTLIASSTAAKTAYDAGIQGQTDAAAAQADATQALADAAAAQATADAAIPDATFTALGELLVGTGNATYVPLDVGSAGQVLTVNATCASGLEWTTPGTGASAATPTVAGLVLGVTNNTSANVAFGCCSFVTLGAGQNNTAIGFCSQIGLTTGSSNTSLGAYALKANQVANNNTAVGTAALCTSTSGQGNTAIGANAMLSLGSGNCNVAVGNNALRAMNGSGCNTAIGANALCQTSSGGCNFAGGQNALTANTSGAENTAAGYASLGGSIGGSGNTAVGARSLGILSSGTDNTAIGRCVANTQTAGNFNVAIGSGVQLPVTTGSCQLAIGFGTTCWLTGCSTGAIRPGFGILDCTGSGGTANQVLASDGGNAICWTSVGTVTCVATSAALTGGPITTTGTLDLATTAVTAATYPYPASLTIDACGRITAATAGASAAPITCLNFTAKGDILAGTGSNTFSALTLGSDGQILYACAACPQGICWGSSTSSNASPTVGGIVFGCTSTTGTNVSLGYNSNCAIGAGLGNTVVGYASLCSNIAGNNNTVVGCGSARAMTGSGLVAVGQNALPVTTVQNIAIGNCAGLAVTTGTANILIGDCAMCRSNTSNNIAIGNLTLCGLQTCSGANVAIGHLAGCALAVGQGNVFVGNRAGLAQTNGFTNVAIGGDAAYLGAGGTRNVVIGHTSGIRMAGVENVVIGAASAGNYSTSCYSVLIGSFAANSLGATANSNVIIGHSAYCAASGASSLNVVLGHQAGLLQSQGSQNVLIGAITSLPVTNGSCQLVIGFGNNNWLTGCSTKAIKPGAGIIDCANSCGTAGQVLMSNGANAVCWGGGVSGTFTFGTCTVVITNGLITSVT